MDDEVSKLDYMEVQYQLQAMELIAQKGPLSEGNLTLLDALEARENDIIQAKLAQTFDGGPRGADNLDNREAWNKAAKDKEFKVTGEALARRHLKDEAALSDKRKEDIRKFGPSADLDAVHASQQRLLARQYDEERGRYAREFLQARQIAQELDERDKQKSLEPQGTRGLMRP